MKIRLVKRDDIDDKKWNSCVHFAPYGNIYGFTWFLDNVAEKWDGLVEGDYESVFPLVWNNKLFGIKQIYQPTLSQQLGLYSTKVISQLRMDNFIKSIPSEFKYISMDLGERNRKVDHPGFHWTERPNHLLLLDRSYEELHADFSKNHKRSIKKGEAEKFQISNHIKPEVFVDFFFEHVGKKDKNLTEADKHAMHRIIYNALHRSKGFISAVLDETNNVLSACFFLSSHDRLTYHLAASSERGREMKSMHILLDIFIRQNAGKRVLLDFEGSAIEGIARFYAGFGAKKVSYLHLEKNDLPFWIKWRKK